MFQDDDPWCADSFSTPRKESARNKPPQRYSPRYDKRRKPAPCSSKRRSRRIAV